MNLHKKALKDAALIRQEAHQKLSAAQKVAKLDARLGKGIGAQKERKKLLGTL